MNKIVFLALTLAAFIFVGCKQQTLKKSDVEGSPASRSAMMAAYQGVNDAEEDMVLIKFKRGFEPLGAVSLGTGGVMSTGVTMVDNLTVELSVNDLKRVFPFSQQDEARHKKHGLDLWYVVKFNPEKANLAKAISRYVQIEELEWVETVKKAHSGDNDMEVEVVKEADYPRTKADGDMPFDDTFLPRMWYLDSKVKVDGKVAGADINIFQAWETISGAPDVIVAVHDQGVQWNHADLASNMWVNKGEIPFNGIDDDKNGYIDDVNGYDFCGWDDKNEIRPGHHGTHVAGIISAVNNNGIGVCGIAGGYGEGTGARILDCQLAVGLRWATMDNIAKSFIYAADQGAVLSQNSWGLSDGAQKVIEEAINYFVLEAGNAEKFPDSPMRGGLVMFAAGNEKNENLIFPQGYENCIAISAINQLGVKAGYSTYGDWVEITAAGGIDPDYEDTSGKQDIFPIFSTIANTQIVKNQYGKFSGTSQACPMVTAVAALLIQANKGLTNNQIKEKLLASVSSLKERNPDIYLKMGSGLLDGSKWFGTGVNDNKSADPIKDLAISQDEKAKEYFLNWTVPAKKGLDWIDTYKLYYSQEPITAANFASASNVVLTQFKRVPQGFAVKLNMKDHKIIDMTKMQYFAITSIDRWGNVSEVSNIVEFKPAPVVPEPGKVGDDEIKIQKLFAKDEIVFSVGKNMLGKDKIMKIIDRVGRVITSQKAEGDITKSTLKISLKGYASGLYNYQVEVGGKVISKGTFTKI